MSVSSFIARLQVCESFVSVAPPGPSGAAASQSDGTSAEESAQSMLERVKLDSLNVSVAARARARLAPTQRVADAAATASTELSHSTATPLHSTMFFCLTGGIESE